MTLDPLHWEAQATIPAVDTLNMAANKGFDMRFQYKSINSQKESSQMWLLALFPRYQLLAHGWELFLSETWPCRCEAMWLWIDQQPCSPFEFKFKECLQKVLSSAACIPYLRNYQPSVAAMQSITEVSSSKSLACWREPWLSYEWCPCRTKLLPRGNDNLTLGLTMRAKMQFPWGTLPGKPLYLWQLVVMI